jgi:hypothetical protein
MSYQSVEEGPVCFEGIGELLQLVAEQVGACTHAHTHAGAFAVCAFGRMAVK